VSAGGICLAKNDVVTSKTSVGSTNDLEFQLQVDVAILAG
jgi:hypothetical protein